MTSLYEERIVDHARNPRGFGPLAGANRHAEGANPLCGDELIVHLRIEGDTVRAGFEGQGCAICLASASMMTEAVREVGQARELSKRVEALALDGLGDLSALGGVAKYPSRVKCALLAWRALIAALDGAPGAVSTES